MHARLHGRCKQPVFTLHQRNTCNTVACHSPEPVGVARVVGQREQIAESPQILALLLLDHLVVHSEIAEVDVDRVKVHRQDAKPFLLIGIYHELAIAHFLHNVFDIVVGHEELAVILVLDCLDQFVLQIILLLFFVNLGLKFLT